jgi:hypothetical protein
MGYNTTVLILNDALDVIQKNPQEFVDKLVSQIYSGKTGNVSVKGWCNPAYVICTAHADIPRVYFSHRNSLVELSAIPENVSHRKYWGEALKRAKAEIRFIEKKIKEEKIEIPKYK